MKHRAEEPVHHWFWNQDAVDGVNWEDWDRLIQKTGRPSVFLDSRMMRAMLSASDRNVAAVFWTLEGRMIGLGLVEDAQAESVNLSSHIKSKGWFDAVSKLLHGRSGRLRFSVRVIGTVLGSGEHAIRFDSDVSPVEQIRCLENNVFSSKSNWGTKVPNVAMFKDVIIAPDVARGSEFKRWTPLEFDPEMVVYVNPEWKDFAAYMAELNTKSRTKIKRILALSEAFEMEDWSLDQLEERGEELIAMYRQVFERSGFRLGSLHLGELIESKRMWGDAFIIKVYKLEGAAVGFQCAFVTREATEAFFVGFDPELRKSHAIYQRMLLEFIRMGIQGGSTEIHMGRTALDVKSSVGALPRRLRCEVRFRNPLAHQIVQAFTKGYKPANIKLKRPWKETSFPVVRHSKIHSI